MISTCIARFSLWEVPRIFWHSVCCLLVAKNMILSCCWNHRDIFLPMGWLHSGGGTISSYCGPFFSLSFLFSLKNHTNNSKFHYCFLSYWHFNFGSYSYSFYFYFFVSFYKSFICFQFHHSILIYDILFSQT